MSRREQITALSFSGNWRRYQTLALEAFGRDLAAGRRRTHVVAPPGSGKTLLGMEFVRRLGAPAVVLAPNTAVQGQWIRAAARFGAGEGVATTDTSGAIACLTYQSLCRLEDPELVLGDVAMRRWARERAAATGDPVGSIIGEAAAWSGEAAKRRDRELAAVRAAIKREIARAEHGELHIGDLFSDAARAQVAALRSAGVATVVLDECHHLASMWGYVVRALVEELGDAHLIGLTATPPDELTRDEADLYAHLLGDVDFTVPTPAVVREGHLAPFQELAWITEPLDSERAWLAERDLRFRELVTVLHEPAPGPASFPEWVIHRLRTRRMGDEGGAEVPWATFVRRHGEFAAAGLRFLGSAGLAFPDGVPHGEAYRTRPSMDDWLLLLEDYALRCLAAQPGEEAAARYAAIAAALSELGFTLTRRGVRRGRSDVDALLTRSAAKSLALADVIATELDVRAGDLRALVLVDAERPRAEPAEDLVGVLRREAGSAVDAIVRLAGDGRTAVTRPVLVSGRGIRCAPHDAAAVIDALRAAADDGAAPALRGVTGDDGLIEIAGDGPGWRPRLWVDLATRAFTAGRMLVLVGTRAMLGEGWDAPCVNVVVDMSAATTSVAVTQMRGRSLRLDPAQPDKLASNWDIVCVAPELVRGDADYGRFVRKHLHVFAPAEDGVVEAGPSHVHPALGPFGPPEPDAFAAINRDVARRAADHDGARRRWRLGEPYEGAQFATVLVRHRGGATAPRPGDAPPAYSAGVRGPATLAGLSAAAGAGLALTVGTGGLAGFAGVPLAAGWLAWRRARAANRLEARLPVDYAACAVRDAYLVLGELSEGAAASMAFDARASGYLRVWLRDGSEQECERFSAALEDLLDPATPPRYVVSRPVPLTGRLAGVRRLIARRRHDTAWVPVPADLGRRRDRAEVFAAACARWLGPGELHSTRRSDTGHRALALVQAAGPEVETFRRMIWR